VSARVDARERELLRQTRAFAVGARSSDDVCGAWQIGSTLLVLAAVTLGMRALDAFAMLLMPVWALVAVRVFVLQHDCGHRSLFTSKAVNDVVGRALAVVTGVAHDGWRLEHDWHHQVTGRLDRRGIDLFNSPMTVEEVRANPTRAEAVQKKVRPLTIAWLGMLALLIDRKRRAGFFIYRPGFVWKVDDGAVRPGLWFNNMAHVALHAGYIAVVGPVAWITAIVPAHVVAGAIGALLFWVQHNFETSVARPGERWSFVEAALHGSSYLRLPQPLRWCTADIGVHHVHHLNSHIPNHRLEAARAAIPALASVAPLTMTMLRTAFTHHFVDEVAGRRYTLAAVRGAADDQGLPDAA
jgi:omega-6 fatty acid desaturase (delta-12 desaturase)